MTPARLINSQLLLRIDPHSSVIFVIDKCNWKFDQGFYPAKIIIIERVSEEECNEPEVIYDNDAIKSQLDLGQVMNRI